MELAARIRTIRRRLGLTQTQFAHALSVDQSTVSRWEKGAKPELENLRDIMALVGESDDVVSTAMEWASTVAPAAMTVEVVGAVQAGAWSETAIWPENEWYQIQVPADPRYPPETLRKALVLRGPSMNKIFPDGTLLVCADTIQLERNALPGEFVIVQRVDKLGLVEATVKEFAVDESGNPYLWPRSNHPEHQQPVSLSLPAGADADDLRIVAVVLASYRLEGPPVAPPKITNKAKRRISR